MSVDGTGIGQNLFFGLIKGVSWGTSVALTGPAGVPIEEISPLCPQNAQIEDTAMGRAFPKQVYNGVKNVAFSMKTKLYKAGALWIPVCQLIGSDSGSVAAGVYTHEITMADVVSGRFFSGAVMIDSTTAQLYEFPSVKPHLIEITQGDGQYLDLNVQGIANDVLIGAAATNDSDNFPGGATPFTYGNEDSPYAFSHCRINMNDNDGAAFDSSGDGSDRVLVNNVSITIGRPNEPDYTANRTTSNARTFQTDEPRASGIHSNILVTLQFNETVDRTFFEEFRDKQHKKMEVMFYLDSSNYVKFEFPKLVPVQPTFAGTGVNRLPSTLPYQALQADSAPTGMSGLTAPVKLTVVNTIDSNQYHDGAAIT